MGLVALLVVLAAAARVEVLAQAGWLVRRILVVAEVGRSQAPLLAREAPVWSLFQCRLTDTLVLRQVRLP